MDDMHIFWGIIEIILGLAFVYSSDDMRRNPDKHENTYLKQFIFNVFGKEYAKSAAKRRVQYNISVWPYVGIGLIVLGIFQLLNIL